MQCSVQAHQKLAFNFSAAVSTAERVT